MNLVIDVGNTRVKAAVFEQDRLVEVVVFFTKQLLPEIKKISITYAIDKAILSNVGHISEPIVSDLHQILPLQVLDSSMNFPFTNSYATPNTLGLDRLCLAYSAFLTFPQKNVLVIDAGTCITYDFIGATTTYYGGAISPGLQMRYKALHNQTAKLPLLEISMFQNFIGNSTEESIHSGIVNGVLQEIKGVISQYKNKYLDLTVVLTGGDTNFLSKQLKSSIFANQNFLLEGLNRILIFNNNK